MMKVYVYLGFVFEKPFNCQKLYGTCLASTLTNHSAQPSYSANQEQTKTQSHAFVSREYSYVHWLHCRLFGFVEHSTGVKRLGQFFVLFREFSFIVKWKMKKDIII